MKMQRSLSAQRSLQQCQANWVNLATFFAWPTDIRKVIHATNTIGSLNGMIRHAIKKRKVFTTDNAVKKVVWLAYGNEQFVVGFGDRLDGLF